VDANSQRARNRRERGADSREDCNEVIALGQSANR
jgi:hypothetical protein